VRAAVSVARLELKERRLLLVAAPVLGVLPLLLHALEGLWSEEAPFAIIYALVLSFAFPVAVAIAAGTSLLARDANEGRLGFYFSRPLSAGALWSGKLLAAAALLVVALLGTSLPTMLASHWLHGAPVALQTMPLWAALGLSVLLMGTSHSLALVYRVRSWWLALDVVIGSLLLLAFWVVFEGLLLEGAGPALERALPGLLACAGIAPLAAVAAQLGRGGADLRHGRGAHSVALWLTLAVGVAALWGFGVWLRRIQPSEAGVGSVAAAPAGPGTLLTPAPGFGRGGFAPAFLMDAATGDWTRISAERLSPLAFSPDGRLAAWVATGRQLRSRLQSELLPGVETGERVPILADWAVNGIAWHGDPGGSLLVARFPGGPPRIDEVALDPADAWQSVLALDAERARAALASRHELGIVDPGTGRVTDRLSVDAKAAEFLPDGALRVYAWEGSVAVGELVVLDWSPADGSRVERARVPGGLLMGLETAGDRALARVVDAARGASSNVLVDVDGGSTHQLGPGRARLLSGGEVALVGGGLLRVFDRAGSVRAEWPFERRILGLVEWLPRQLALGVWEPGGETWETTELFDLEAGRVLRSEPGLLPVGGPGFAQHPPQPGSAGARLFRTRPGGLVSLEADGTRRVVVPDPE